MLHPLQDPAEGTGSLVQLQPMYSALPWEARLSQTHGYSSTGLWALGDSL